jgi:hypothetical protein
MNFFVDKSITTISFEVIPRTEEVEQEQQTLMKETCIYVFVHQEEIFSHVFYDFVACYMECFYNQDLHLMVNCKILNKYEGKPTSVLNMGFSPPGVSFQSMLSYGSENCYL